MLKNRRKTADDSAYNPYECAAQLKDLLVESNLSPIMTMVVYEFLSDVIEHKVPRDASIYEYIQKCFEEKLRFVILDTNSEAEIRNKAKAYLILLLEIISHSRFVEGIDIDLYRVKMDGAETSVKVRFDAKNFKVDKRGYEFIENVNQIKEKNQSGSQLISSLSKCTTDAVDYILERYKSHADKFDEGDVIVIDSIQA